MRSILRSFGDDERGNFGLVAALLAVPLVMGAGLMIDLSTISRTRAELQNAMDSAALAVAREGKDITNAEARVIADRFVDENFDPKYTKLALVRRGDAFTVKAVTRANMAFGGLFGYDDWEVSAASTAEMAFASYEIALVLDTTGSMAGGKLVAMKDAVVGLIDTMSLQVKDKDKLKFAMVPFATFVNVGPGFGPSFTKKGKKGKQVPGTGAPWLDLNATVKLPQSELAAGASRFQLYKNLKGEWPGCVETRYAAGTDIDIDDTTPDASKPGTLFVPTFAIDEPDTGGFPNNYITSDAKPNDNAATQKKKRWAKYGVDTDAAGNPLNGGVIGAAGNIVTDPATGLDVVAPDAATPAELDTGVKGPGKGCGMQPITPLTNTYKALKKKVEALQASGTTNITEGVAWGLRVLSPKEPFAESQSASKKIERTMIVLTDGSNVFGTNNTALGSAYASQGYLVDGRLGIQAGGESATNALMNQRTLAACQAAKDEGIEIYTIRLEEPNVATGSMLRECASGEDHYFDVPSRSQLDDAFSRIGEKIARVRISS